MAHAPLFAFARVVEAGSFTAAAAALGLRKSSVSRSVAALEADLGIRLLQRTTRKLSLTDAGRAYYDRARDALAGLEEAEQAVSSLGADARVRAEERGTGDLARVTAAMSTGAVTRTSPRGSLRARRGDAVS